MRVIAKFYNFFLSPDKELARKLRSLLGFVPYNLRIFKLAFSHKSSPSDKAYAMQNNERLEYLGDAVLGTIVAEYLFRKYPNANEGFLTKMRSKIVKRKSLNKIGEKMGLDLLLSEYNQTRLSRSMLGNAVEALVGAVYLERGTNARAGTSSARSCATTSMCMNWKPTTTTTRANCWSGARRTGKP